MKVFDFLKKNELNRIAELQNDLDNSKNTIDNLQNKYGKIIDVESETGILEAKLTELQSNFDNIDIRYKNSLKIYNSLRKECESLVFDLKSMQYGIYNPIFDYSHSESYKSEIEWVVEQQKFLIKIDDAAECNTNWTVNNSSAKGQTMIKRQKQLMIRAFNGECDSLISKVKWNNYEKIHERIIKSFEKINSLGKSNSVVITQKYFDLKITELQLTHEYNLKITSVRLLSRYLF
jgi:hypothetical protein